MENESKFKVKVIRTIIKEQIIELETWATTSQSAKKQALEFASKAEEIDLKPIKQNLEVVSCYHFDIWS